MTQVKLWYLLPTLPSTEPKTTIWYWYNLAVYDLHESTKQLLMETRMPSVVPITNFREPMRGLDYSWRFAGQGKNYENSKYRKLYNTYINRKNENAVSQALSWNMGTAYQCNWIVEIGTEQKAHLITNDLINAQTVGETALYFYDVGQNNIGQWRMIIHSGRMLNKVFSRSNLQEDKSELNKQFNNKIWSYVGSFDEITFETFIYTIDLSLKEIKRANKFNSLIDTDFLVL